MYLLAGKDSRRLLRGEDAQDENAIAVQNPAILVHANVT